MQIQPTISVIIPNYNNAQYLTECIDSVFAQTYQPLECIVVDDGSTDNSLEVLNNLSGKYPKLKVFEQINSGPSVARNLGMKHAQGEYFAMLDADDYWSDTKLENQVKVINQIDEEKHIITSQDIKTDAKGKLKKSIAKGAQPPYTLFDALARNVAIGSCSSILFPRTLIKATGGYNPVLKSSEDQDFHLRSILAGYQFFHSEEIDVYIRYHPHNSSKNIIYNIYFHLIALEIQTHLIKNEGLINGDSRTYKNAIKNRIGTILYWAKLAQRKDIQKSLRLIAINKTGILFYYKNRIINWIYSYWK